MTTVWIVLGSVAAACLCAFAVWRVRGANRLLQRILDEERAETERQNAHPAEPEAPERPNQVHRSRGGGSS